MIISTNIIRQIDWKWKFVLLLLFESNSLTSFFRGAEILYSLAVANARHAGMEGRYPVSDYGLLVDARRSVGLFQHHDAITGTAKENVVTDYGNKYGSEGLKRRYIRWANFKLGQKNMTFLFSRLLRSLIGLKRVIINAAHFLVMKNKDFYRFYQTEPFLDTVSSNSCAAVLDTHVICFFLVLDAFSVHSPGWQTRYPRLSASAHSNWTGPSRATVFSSISLSFYLLSPLFPFHSLNTCVPFTQTDTWLCSTPLSRSVSARWRCWWTRWRCECLRRMDRLYLCSWALSGALLVRWALRCLR